MPWRPILAPGSRIISPDRLDALLKEKCGYLEEQQEKEFFEFIYQRLFSGDPTPKEKAELIMTIEAEMLISHTRGGPRRQLVEAYKSVTTNRK
jgi:hypothetical protein